MNKTKYTPKNPPRGLTQRKDSKTWVGNSTVSGKRHRISFTQDFYESLVLFQQWRKQINYADEAINRVRASVMPVFYDGAAKAFPNKLWSEEIEKLFERRGPNNWAKTMFSSIRFRARKFNKPFNLTHESIKKLLIRSNGYCELTHIPFSMHTPAGVRRPPFLPSIDRIDSKNGYTFDNCRVVCLSVNIALNEWGEGVLLKISAALVKRHCEKSMLTLDMVDDHLAWGDTNAE